MHRFANPAKFLKLARPLTILFGIGGLFLLGVGVFAGLFVTPPDFLQGESVRIMYVHVPAAMLSTIGWSGIAVASIVQLVWRHPLAGVAARACAVPGSAFTAICLATGSLWGRPTWGTYWQWDGRMTSVLVLLFLYIGYIALAAAGDEKTSVSRAAAIFGVVGAINIPIIKGSVEWWNTLHQGRSITLSGSKISPEIIWPLYFTMSGFSLLFAAIVLMRMRAIIANAKLEARMKRMVSE